LDAMPLDQAELLRRLRDQVFECYRSSPASEIRHALMFEGWPRLTPEERESWWNEIAGDVGAPPIGVAFSSLRVEMDDAFFKKTGVPFGESPDQRCFADKSGMGSYRQFIDQANQIAKVAARVMKAKGISYIPERWANCATWCLACYMLVWDFPTEVPYRWGYFVDGGTSTGPPIANRQTFEKWERWQLKLDPGVSFLWLDSDVRLVTVNAIDAILEMASPARPTPKKPRRGKAAPDATTDFVPCSQADLWGANDVSKRAGYVDYLKRRGVILDYKRKGKSRAVASVKFADTPEGRNLKKRVLDVQAKKGRRRRPRVAQR
jgi:hypothetical protein